jgi:hypothetical protein
LEICKRIAWKKWIFYPMINIIHAKKCGLHLWFNAADSVWCEVEIFDLAYQQIHIRGHLEAAVGHLNNFHSSLSIRSSSYSLFSNCFPVLKLLHLLQVVYYCTSLVLNLRVLLMFTGVGACLGLIHFHCVFMYGGFLIK